MPHTALRRPAMMDPEQASVLDPMWQQILRLLVDVSGGDDPAQILGVLGAAGQKPPLPEAVASWILKARQRPATTPLAKAFAKDMEPLRPLVGSREWDSGIYQGAVKKELTRRKR